MILDSVYVEFLLLDTVETFLPGCPDPVDIDIVLERSYIFSGFISDSGGNYNRVYSSESLLGYQHYLFFWFFDDGKYKIEIQNEEVAAMTLYSWGSMWSDQGDGDVSIPFPSSWDLDENGVQVDWQENGWVHNSQSFRLIPFWHGAE